MTMNVRSALKMKAIKVDKFDIEEQKGVNVNNFIQGADQISFFPESTKKMAKKNSMISYFLADSNMDVKTVMNLQLLAFMLQLPFFTDLQQKADFEMCDYRILKHEGSAGIFFLLHSDKLSQE